MHTYISIMVRQCDSCGRPAGEHFYLTFRSEETAILARLSPSFTELDGMSTEASAPVIKQWITELLGKPLVWAKPDSGSRHSLWPEYGRVIDMLISLKDEVKHIKGELKIVQRDTLT